MPRSATSKACWLPAAHPPDLVPPVHTAPLPSSASASPLLLWPPIITSSSLGVRWVWGGLV